MCDDLLAGGVVGVTVQAITGLDGVSQTRQQLTKALDRGLRIAGYTWCFPGSSVASRLSFFDGFAIEWLGLDVEQAGLSIADVDRDLTLCDDYAGQLADVYTGRWFFANQGWLGLSRWSNRRLWDANYDDIPEPDVDFVPYGGWTSCYTKQFFDKQIYGNVVCDVNFRRTS